jgi:SAM-dependent methyltransferase
VPNLWNKQNSVDKSKLAEFPPSYPNEMLVKILSSTFYSPLKSELPPHPKVLEVGIFSGNNARFFLENGYDLTGSELNSEMVKLGQENLTRLGYDLPSIKIGHNINLDFPSNLFDLLVSVNTIHYSSGENSRKALSEFCRVLKPVGWAVIETPACEHFAVKRSTRKGILEYEWQAGGFRQGELFGFYDSEEHFKKSLMEVFSEVSISRRLEIYPETTLDFWMAVCKK